MIPRLASFALLLSALFCTTSCFELIDFEPDVPAVEPGMLSLPLHQVDIMVGDSILLEPHIEPDSASYDAFWFTSWDGPDAPLAFDGSMIRAVREGSLWVYVKALGLSDVILSDSIDAESVVDSCLVNVFNWRDSIPSDELATDMVINANIVLNDSLAFDPATMELVALMDGEVVGHGQLLEDFGIQYTYIRIWRPEVDFSPVSLQLYDHSRIRRISLQHPPLYFDGETHGTLSSLLKITGTL